MMLTGIRLKANPTDQQKLILSQWIGCARFIWNAKCDENRYYTAYARKFCPIGTYAPIDKKYSHFKNNELSPWLSDCPSKILANSACNWFDTYHDFLKGRCGKPKRKKKADAGSIYLTRELFRFEVCADGVKRLFIGTERNNIGYLPLKIHKKFRDPASLYIKKRHHNFHVSFCYDDAKDEGELLSQTDHLNYLRSCSDEFLQRHLIGLDRGVKRPVQAGDLTFDFTPEQKKNKAKRERHIRRYQRQKARQEKGSARRYKTVLKLSKAHEAIGNIRKDFCHKTTRALVDHDEWKVFILEDLKTKQMTSHAKAKKDENGKWLKNGASAKSGLNRNILDRGWHQFEILLKYKASRAGKAWIKVSAHHTSQECGACGHTHPSNRKNQDSFLCGGCGHTDNADRNAAEVIKKRAINLILNSGSELSKRGVLFFDNGRGADGKSRRVKAPCVRGVEASKTKKRNPKVLPLDFALEASPSEGLR